ncbi:hypothetical protein [Streptomyces sp. NPDC012888]|uniref:hypothetical protein n=1 Tax=Streptomyces sp. NPDC012888 TaxID=3364855 RepID=UPI0036994108
MNEATVDHRHGGPVDHDRGQLVSCRCDQTDVLCVMDDPSRRIAHHQCVDRDRVNGFVKTARDPRLATIRSPSSTNNEPFALMPTVDSDGMRVPSTTLP